LLGEQPECPVGKPFRRLPKPQGDDLGLLLAVEHLAADPALRFALEGDLEPFGHQAFAQALHGMRPTIEGVGDPGVRPVRTVHIGLQQDAGPPHFLGRNSLLLQQPGQHLPLGVRQPNNVFLSHGPTLRGWGHHDQNRPMRLP
jgi:hypothetical protein